MASRLGIDVGGTFTDLLLFNDDSGDIYVAISNHQNYPNGNVAIFKYDPVLNQMRFLNDLKAGRRDNFSNRPS